MTGPHYYTSRSSETTSIEYVLWFSDHIISFRNNKICASYLHLQCSLISTEFVTVVSPDFFLNITKYIGICKCLWGHIYIGCRRSMGS